VIIKLPEPFIYENFEITEINLNLEEKLNPKTQNVLEQKYYREILGKTAGMSELTAIYHEQPAVDKRFRLMVFEWFTGYPKEAITSEKFPLRAYNQIITYIGSFFMELGQPSMETQSEEGM
jgi:hypothetical protein